MGAIAGKPEDPLLPVLSRQSLDSYCENLLDFRPAKHHKLINKYLEKVESGEIKRLMIFAPPGSAKSSYATVAYPGWYIGRNKDRGVICASHEKGLAEGFSRRVRNWVNSNEYYEIFDLELSKDSKSVSRWQVQYDENGKEKRGAEYYAVGVNSSITGKRADCLLGSTQILTDKGVKRIEDIDVSAETYYTASYDGKSPCPRRIIANLSREAEEYLKIHTASGRVVEVTGNHRIYTKGGYVVASSIAEGDALLSLVSGRKDMGGMRLQEETESRQCRECILLAKLLDALSESKDVREWAEALQSLCDSTGREEDSKTLDLLLRRILHACGQEGCVSAEGHSTDTHLPTLQQRIQASQSDVCFKILQQMVQRQGACEGDVRQEQSWLEEREQSIAAAEAFRQSVSADEANYYCAGQSAVRGLCRNPALACSSHQYGCNGQSLAEPRDTMQALSSEVARGGALKTEEDTVVMVERVCEPVKVYDIQVEGTECFFANGILLHNCGIIDDPVKGRKEADSETVRESTWQWYLTDFRTRLKPQGTIIIIQTRWHGDDLSGRILPDDYDGGSGEYTAKDGEKWFVLSLPALARENDILGRAVGEPLWPALEDGTPWYTKAAMEQEKLTQGTRNFNALYQQVPSEEEGGIIKKAWWRKWPSATPPKILYLIQSYDTAFSEEDSADPTARTTWGVFNYQEYLRVVAETEGIEIPEDEKKRSDKIKYAIILLERLNERLSYPELRKEAKASFIKYQPDRIIIEKKASGQSLIQDMRKADLPIVGITLAKYDDKVSRANTASIVPESGLVFYMDRDWAKEVINQCADFPNGKHDDIVDSCVQAWAYLYRRFWLNIPDEQDVNPFNSILKAQSSSRNRLKRYYGSSGFNENET